MSCSHQQLAVPMPGKTRNGKTPMKFIGKARDYYTRYQSVKGLMFLPCRQCIDCRLERSRQWATRLIHEIPNHKASVFATLTYDDDHIPIDKSLNPSHLTTFFKNLRAKNDHHGNDPIKYFACGEYGDQRGRPHYHAIIYGHIGIEHPENRRERPSRSGDPQYSNPLFSSTWPHGELLFSEHNFETAAYVARYILKKVQGASQALHYGTKTPEFQRCSKGLGKGHIVADDGTPVWLGDIYPADHVVLPGRGAFLPPPYYDRLLEKVDPALYARVKTARKENSQKIETRLDFLEEVAERTREGEVRKLVTEKTLIRGIDQ